MMQLNCISRDFVTAHHNDDQCGCALATIRSNDTQIILRGDTTTRGKYSLFEKTQTRTHTQTPNNTRTNPSPQSWSIYLNSYASAPFLLQHG